MVGTKHKANRSGTSSSYGDHFYRTENKISSTGSDADVLPASRPKFLNKYPSNSRSYASAEPATPSPKQKMGIRETGDYITARAANPRTGLISPSVLTAQTPRTPMTPGEALRLYGHACPQQSPSTTGPKLLAQQMMQKRHRLSANRWRQHDKGWFMENLTELASPKTTTTDSFPVQSDTSASLSDDRFIMPMPSAREPRPYRSAGVTAAQIAALERYKQTYRRQPHGPLPLSPSGLNGRMPSAGAGPRKFAEASKKLRTRTQTTQSQNEREVDIISSDVTATTFAPFQSPPSASSGGTTGVTTTTKSMPGSFEDQGTLVCIPRKPIGSSSRKRECRDDDYTDLIAPSIRSKHVGLSPDLDYVETSPPTASSNSTRPRAFRQLPQYYPNHPIHPDNRFEGLPDSPNASPNSTLSTIVSLPSARYSLMSNSSGISIIYQDRPSILEAYLIRALSSLAIHPIQWTQSIFYPSISKSSDPGIIHALNTLTNEKADPAERLAAAKALTLMVGRAMVMLAILAVVVRVCVFVGRALEVVFWPVSVFLRLLRWVLLSEG